MTLYYKVEWFKNSEDATVCGTVESDLSLKQAQKLKNELDENWDLSIIQGLSFRVLEV